MWYRNTQKRLSSVRRVYVIIIIIIAVGGYDNLKRLFTRDFLPKDFIRRGLLKEVLNINKDAKKRERRRSKSVDNFVREAEKSRPVMKPRFTDIFSVIQSNLSCSSL